MAGIKIVKIIIIISCYFNFNMAFKLKHLVTGTYSTN